MEPEPPGPVAPGFVDGPLQELPAQALVDELRHQAELDEFDVVRVAPVQLGKS
jgi:hypothetical protein